MFRPTIPEDVMKMAPNVRKEDETEVRSISGLTPLEALTVGLIHSPHCVTGFGKSGDIALIAGVVPRTSSGSVWMISTPEITRNAREVLTGGRLWLNRMNELYGPLTNVADARNTTHLRLIEHMGFTFGEAIENHGVDKVRVIPFTRK